MLELIGAVLKLILHTVGVWSERDGNIKKKKEIALDEVKKGIIERDASAINSGFDKLNRVR